MATDKLTPAQSLAVERRGGPILISAAAGSGKTRVIVERLMRRILSREEECNVNDFLIITFTKKAASELRERIARELALRLAEEPENRHLQNQQSRIYLTQISTVHSFCAELLREFAYELDIPADFRMLDETEARALREQIAEDLMEERYASGMEDPNFQNLVDGLGIGRDDRMVPQLLLQVYNTAQCRLYPDQWLTDCQAALAIDDIDAAEKTIWGASQISDFHDFLCGQEALLRMAVSSIAECPALEKYLPLFEENTDRLRELAALDGWDALWNAAQQGVDFGRLPVLRNCDEPALQERVKDIRTDVIDRVRKWLSEFYAPSSEVLDDLCQTGGTLRSLISLTQEFSRRYAAEKLRQHTLDFGDLEHNAVRLLLRVSVRLWWMSTRIRTRFRTASSAQSPGTEITGSWSATSSSRSTASVSLTRGYSSKSTANTRMRGKPDRRTASAFCSPIISVPAKRSWRRSTRSAPPVCRRASAVWSMARTRRSIPGSRSSRCRRRR